VEQVLASLARRTHGVVTRRELLAAGVTPDEIRERLECGALLREFMGVYRVGHQAPSVEASYLAAVRACGESAALRGKAAAFLYGLIRRRRDDHVSPHPDRHRARRADRLGRFPLPQ
jgi:hypothetical protein